MPYADRQNTRPDSVSFLFFRKWEKKQKLIKQDAIKMKKTIKMNLSKSTKGTHVYANDEPGTPVSSIYIKRSGLPSEAPAIITLTIDYEDNNTDWTLRDYHKSSRIPA